MVALDRKLRWILLMFGLFCGVSYSMAAGSPWGVWANYDNVMTKGVMTRVKWSQFEPEQGVFNLAKLRPFVQQPDPRCYAILLMKHTHSITPDWLYDDYGVPKLHLEGGAVYPYYMYQNEQGEYVYVELVAEYLKNLIRGMRAKLVDQKFLSIQFIFGPDGDPGAFHRGQMPVNLYDYYQGSSKKEWNRDWAAFKVIMSDAFLAALDEVNAEFLDCEPVLPLVNDEMLEWALATEHPFMFKAGNVTQYFHGRFDDRIARVYEAIHQRLPDGSYYRTRAEMQNVQLNYFQKAERWCMNYQCLWNLTFGLDTWQLQQFTNKEGVLMHLSKYPLFWPMYDFFNKYAGYREAQESPGAWIAFRDGLDYSDVQRFPEAIYGKLNRNNKDRVRAVLDNFANPPGGFGAQILDWSAIGTPAANGYNLEHSQSLLVQDRPDVAWEIWDANYALFITQIDANETTYSHFRVGDPAVDKWGRYARGISGADPARSKIYLDVDDRFTESGPQDLYVKIVYYDADDQAGQSWFLNYNSATGPVSIEQIKQGGDVWRTLEQKLEGVVLGNGLDRSADLIIGSSSDPDAHSIFAFLELMRTSPLSEDDD